MEANPNPSAIGNGGGYDNSHTSALTVLNSIGYVQTLIPSVADTFDYTDGFRGAKNLLSCYFSPHHCVRKKIVVSHIQNNSQNKILLRICKNCPMIYYTTN